MSEGSRGTPSPSPWPHCGPRKPSVPSHVQECNAQFVWFPCRANPFLAHALGGPRASAVSRRTAWIGQRLIRSRGSEPTPLLAHCPSHCEDQANALFTSNGT